MLGLHKIERQLVLKASSMRTTPSERHACEEIYDTATIHLGMSWVSGPMASGWSRDAAVCDEGECIPSALEIYVEG